MKKKLFKLSILGLANITILKIIVSIRNIYNYKLASLQLKNSNETYFSYKLLYQNNLIYFVLILINLYIIYKIFKRVKEK